MALLETCPVAQVSRFLPRFLGRGRRYGPFARSLSATGSISDEAVKGVTIQRVSAPTAILVALADELATVVTTALDSAGLKVMRASHVAAACERIPMIMPQLVVVPSGLEPEESERLADRCVAVGAVVMAVGPEMDARALATVLKNAANAALVRALSR
jgi:hypothetical protein